MFEVRHGPGVAFLVHNAGIERNAAIAVGQATVAHARIVGIGFGNPNARFNGVYRAFTLFQHGLGSRVGLGLIPGRDHKGRGGNNGRVGFTGKRQRRKQTRQRTQRQKTATV